MNLIPFGQKIHLNQLPDQRQQNRRSTQRGQPQRPVNTVSALP